MIILYRIFQNRDIVKIIIISKLLNGFIIEKESIKVNVLII